MKREVAMWLEGVDGAGLHERVCGLHGQVGGAVRRSVAGGGASEVRAVTSADTIFAIDRDVEPVLDGFFADLSAWMGPLVLIAEGMDEAERGEVREDLGEGVVLYGCSGLESARSVAIVDPIDGTRGVMYDKRSAWFLLGMGPLVGWPARGSELGYGFMGELGTSKAGLLDRWWAFRGGPARGERLDLSGGLAGRLEARPSGAADLRNGFGMLSKFFPAGKEILCGLECAMLARLGLGRAGSGGLVDGAGSLVFDDQYICTGGQLVELMSGHDRFNADLRSFAHGVGGIEGGLCCHAYDLAGLLVAEAAGVVVTDAAGGALDFPLDCTGGVDWVAYANAGLRGVVEPALQAAMAEIAGLGRGGG